MHFAQFKKYIKLKITGADMIIYYKQNYTRMLLNTKYCMRLYKD